jgi:hypothetical protein
MMVTPVPQLILVMLAIVWDLAAQIVMMETIALTIFATRP